MKEKNKLRVIQFLCIISLLITVFSIQRTYAKYFEKIDTTYATKIKRWVIKVNEKNIHNEQTLTNVMTPQFFYNEHMNTNGNLNNILAPGRIGYFDFLIDYTNVDLTFKFAFDIEQLNIAKLTDFEVYGYKIIDTNYDMTPTTTINDIGEITILSKINGEYQLAEITQEIDPTTETDKQKRVLVLFKWNDDEENKMNNIQDTAFKGTNIESDSVHTNLNYKVKITFTQKI